jgi:hypothetical protein
MEPLLPPPQVFPGFQGLSVRSACFTVSKLCHRLAWPVSFFALALGICQPAHLPSGPLNINGQSGTTIENLQISSSTGPCITITNSTNITIHNSEIGPCGSNGVSISGGSGIKIVDNFIHPEVPSVIAGTAGCCDHGNGIIAAGTTNLLIQGNVIAWGEANISLNDLSTATIKGNYLLNPQNNGNRGQQIIGAGTGASNITVDSNYTYSEFTGAGIYKHPARQEDAINFESSGQDGSTNITVTNNYIWGGNSGSGCGIIADSGASNMNINHNALRDTGQCGIGIADGTGHIVNSNKVINSTPVAGGGNTAIYVWKVYPWDHPCANITVSNNVASELKPDMITESGFWNGGGCEPVTLSGNTFDAAARALLTPVSSKLPPPPIPPVPYSCAAVSPFTNQTMSSCNATVIPTVTLVQPAPASTISGMTQLTATASADVTTVKFFLDGGQTMLGQDTASPWTISVNTTGITNGDHVLTAVAGNQFGTETTSSAIPVVIQNSGPPPPPPPAGSLNTNLWRFLNPVGNGTYATNGSALFLTAPAGSNHDPAFGGANNSVRVVQTVGNNDFLLELKFDSIPTLQYQFEGLIVEQDPTNYLRFQFASAGNSLVVNASQVVSNVETPLIGGVVSIPNSTTSLWMRVQKSGSTWTYTWSPNGLTYNNVGSFVLPLTLSNLGPFVGNYNSPPTAAPAFTARLDYFINKIPPPPGPPVSDTFNH